MGFPSGSSSILLPNLLLHLLSLLGLIRASILLALRLTGLSDFLEPDSPQPDPVHPPRSGPASALIREILPVMKFSDIIFAGAGETPPESCAVCLSDFDGDDEIRQLRNCRHIFHRECVDRWMDHEQSTCPLCRASFVPDEMQRDLNDRLWADVYGECFPIF